MSCVEHAVPRARQQLRNATVTSVQSILSLPTPSPPPLSAPSSLPPPWPVLATSSIFATDASRSYRPWAGFLQPSPPTPTLPPPRRRRPHVFRAAVSLVLPRAVELERVQAAVCRVGIGMSRPVCPDWVLECDPCTEQREALALIAWCVDTVGAGDGVCPNPAGAAPARACDRALFTASNYGFSWIGLMSHVGRGTIHAPMIHAVGVNNAH